MYTLKMWGTKSSVVTGGLEVDDNHFKLPGTIIILLKERCLANYKCCYTLLPRVTLQLTKEQVVQHSKLCEKFQRSYYAEMISALNGRELLEFMAEWSTSGEFQWDDDNNQLVIQFTLSLSLASKFLSLHDLS